MRRLWGGPTFKLIQAIGRIQLFAVVGLKTHFFLMAVNRRPLMILEVTLVPFHLIPLVLKTALGP